MPREPGRFAFQPFRSCSLLELYNEIGDQMTLNVVPSSEGVMSTASVNAYLINGQKSLTLAVLVNEYHLLRFVHTGRVQWALAGLLLP